MAAGDQADMAWRLGRVLPAKWFPDAANAPVLQAVLNGLGAGLSALYTQISYAALQTRLSTATDSFLDLASFDYLGGSLPRRAGERDSAFRARILREIIRPRVTRASITRVLTDLTGRAPAIFEPALPSDTGGYGTQGMTAGTGLGYGLAGGWGSLSLPNQAFVIAYRATSGGIPSVAGFYTGSGWSGGGYGVGAAEWASLDMSQGQITDTDIDAAVASVMPAGGIAWVSIQN